MFYSDGKPNSPIDLELYGKISVETDFHSDPEVRAEIGFNKKF